MSLKPPSSTALGSKSGVASKSGISSKSGVASKSGIVSKSGIRSGSHLSSKSRTGSRSRVGLSSRSRLSASSRTGFGDGEGGEGDEWLQARDPVKPDDQLELTEEELKEEHTRILRGENPQAPDNIVRFSFKELAYSKIATVEQYAMHFSMDGNLIHLESDEARRQNARKNIHRRKAAVATSEAGTDAAPEEKEDDAGGAGEEDGGDQAGESGDGDGEEAAEAAEEPAKEEDSVDTGPKKKLRNQFNFSERASQTFNHATKERGLMTVPPPRSTFSGSCTQWEIYDAYKADKAAQAAKAAKELAEKTGVAVAAAPAPVTIERSVTLGDDSGSVWAQSAKIVKTESAKKVERMVVQNIYDDVLHDFKFWVDESDQFKSEGSLLPLWKFVNDGTKKKQVTALVFNPKYTDMVGVGSGSYNYAEQDTGGFTFFSLKNPAAPEIFIQTKSGVMSIDIHPEAANLVAVGLYDGSVAVYNLASKDYSVPTHRSTAITGKHTDPVWQVKWQADDVEKRHNFYSVSADGNIRSWTMFKAELIFRNIIQLRRTEDTNVVDPNPLLYAGTCFAFNESEKNLFIVGTESGKLLKCSKAYSSQYISTYDSHNMAVYSIVWNNFHNNVFASASADWTVKIWDHTYPVCLFEFDLGSPVGAVAWAPYSSSVFAAVTSDGRVHIFDLGVSKTEPICVQQVLKKGKLTHVAFNAEYPIIVVGDDFGCVNSLKLSPNLTKALQGKVKLTREEEIDRLEKLLDSVKELDIHTGKPLALSD